MNLENRLERMSLVGFLWNSTSTDNNVVQVQPTPRVVGLPSLSAFGEPDATSPSSPSPTVSLCQSAAKYHYLQQHNNYSSVLDQAQTIVYTRVIFAVAVFGFLANLCNLVVLGSKTLRAPLSRLERFAYTGLAALAFSDLCYCLMTIPHGFADYQSFVFESRSFDLYYGYGGHVFINTFLLSSVLLTVLIACGRYLGICYPLKARQMTGKTCAIRSIIAIFIISIALNVPKFWIFEIKTIHCPEDKVWHLLAKGSLRTNEIGFQVYSWIYFTLAIFIPLLALTYCNVHLGRGLRRAAKQGKRIRVSTSSAPGKEQRHARTTCLLCLIVFVYILFVTPPEIINFLRSKVPPPKGETLNEAYNLLVAIGNALQAISLSANFFFYFTINAHFRTQMVDVFCCRKTEKSWNDVTISGTVHQQREQKRSSSGLVTSNAVVNGKEVE